MECGIIQEMFEFANSVWPKSFSLTAADMWSVSGDEGAGRTSQQLRETSPTRLGSLSPFRHVRRETCLQTSHKVAKKSAQLQVYEHFSLLALWSVVGFTWRDVDKEDNRIIFKPWNRKSDKFLHTRVTGVQWSSCCFVQFLGRRNRAGRMLFVSVLISIDIFV